MTVERMVAKVIDLVETAGFVYAVSLDQPGAFQILDANAEVVGHGVVTARGFEALFPRRSYVKTPTALVDVLEQIKAEQS